MQILRYFNIVAWLLLPVITYILLQSDEKTRAYSVPSAVITAMSPVGILMGTTAQPEPLFALLIMLFVLLFEKKDYYSSSFVLAVACLLRYEAWAVLVFISGYVLFLRFFRQGDLTDKKKISILSVIIVPVFFIFMWSLLRYYSDGQWFLFLTKTQKFANDALGRSSSAEGGFLNFISDLFYYPVWIPFLYFGIALFLIPFGIKRFIKENTVLFLTGISILVFITVSWLMKSNLGLNRHFNSIVPFYSIMMTYGLFALIGKTKQFFENKVVSKSALAKITSSRFWFVLLFVNLAVYMIMWLSIYTVNNNGTFDERYRAVDYIKTISDNSIIVCNDPVIEVLSGVDYRRFDHYWMGVNDETLQYLKSLMRYNNNVYVVAGEELKNYLRFNSILMYESGPNPRNGNNVYILKII